MNQKGSGLRTGLQCRMLGLQSSAGTHFSLLVIFSSTTPLVFKPFSLSTLNCALRIWDR